MKRIALIAVLFSLPAHAEDVFACNLRGLTEAQRARHAELTKALVAGLAETKELPDGFGFRLPSESIISAAEWVSYEHKCCPFFTLSLEQSRDDGPLWLRLTGSSGVKAFIRKEFKL